MILTMSYSYLLGDSMLMYCMDQNVRNEVIPCFLPVFKYQMLSTNSESMFLGFRILYFIIQKCAEYFQVLPPCRNTIRKNLIWEVVLSLGQF